MRPIVTLTINPTIDAFCRTDRVIPVRKVRTHGEHYVPGGGGLNASRMIRELGGATVAFYMAGGLTGQALEGMVERTGLAAVRIPMTGLTRVSHVVLEESTGQEYRFTPEGPDVEEAEWRHCLEVLAVVEAPYVVASGSLAPGIPADFYAQVARLVKERGGRMVVDSSGPPLREALAEGVHLIKPSRGELEKLLGRTAASVAEAEALALEVVASGRAEIVALTLGAEGAVLATRDGAIRLSSPKVETRSAVGAGDAFLGAMMYAMASGQSLPQAFALGSPQVPPPPPHPARRWRPVRRSRACCRRSRCSWWGVRKGRASL
jgi:6-phosphofructokinase 2